MEPQLSDIRLIGLDLDGTTLNSEKELTPRTHKAIEAAGRAGIQVLPATGRQLAGVPAAFLQIPGVQYALCANGAAVFRLQQSTPLFTDFFNRESALRLLAACNTFDMITAVFIGGKTYSQTIDYDTLEQIAGPAVIRYLKDTRHTTPNLAELIEKSDAMVEKFSILFLDLAVRSQAMQAFAARGDCTVTSSFETNMELNTPTANKGAALVRLGGLLGIKREQIMAVGDGLNDHEMLKTVGVGVAMANGMPELKRDAAFVTASCDEDGVAKAIEKVLAAKGFAG